MNFLKKLFHKHHWVLEKDGCVTVSYRFLSNKETTGILIIESCSICKQARATVYEGPSPTRIDVNYARTLLKNAP